MLITGKCYNFSLLTCMTPGYSFALPVDALAVHANWTSQFFATFILKVGMLTVVLTPSHQL